MPLVGLRKVYVIFQGADEVKLLQVKRTVWAKASRNRNTQNMLEKKMNENTE